MAEPSFAIRFTKTRRLKLAWLVATFFCAALCGTLSLRMSRAQQPATAPSTTPSSLAAELQSRRQALNSARSELVAASLLWPRNESAITENLKAVGNAELAFAQALALGISQNQQALVNKATVERGRRIPNIPHLTDRQSATLTQMAGPLDAPALGLTKARDA